jgi:hypothetical protein
MFLKNVLVACICATVLAWNSPSGADEYRPGQYFGLDLSKALLSPKRLGPAAQFAPVPVEAQADRESEAVKANSSPEIPAHRTRVAHLGADKPRHAPARTKLAHRHTDPMDAEAFDTRIQVWPCRSGGICNWKRPSP